jgi:dCTP deaminase
LILPAQTIRALCFPEDILADSLLYPFVDRTQAPNGMTYGLSGAGYDIRFANGFIGINGVQESEIVLRPGDFALCSAIERFNIPDDIVCRVADKSSWARRGVAVQNTVIEPGWRGYLTLEITNHGPAAWVISQGDPIAQVLFERLEAPTTMPYRGKYHNQPSHPVPAK